MIASAVRVNGAHEICSDCHVAHASSQDESWLPTEHLLKYGGSTELCLSCHFGSAPDAPDVIAAGSAASPSDAVSTEYTSHYGSSAGFFQSDYLSAANPYGHDLRPGVPVTARLMNARLVSLNTSASSRSLFAARSESPNAYLISIVLVVCPATAITNKKTRHLLQAAGFGFF